MLMLTRGARRLELPLDEIAVVEPWRLPIPCAGVSLRLASGAHWQYGIAHADPIAFGRALAAAGGVAAQANAPSRARAYAQAIGALRRGRLDQVIAKFVLLPFALAVPAFRLHQHIAYGSSFGEYYSFGLKAYLSTFMLWWAAWTIGVVLCAAALRTAIEAGTLVAVLVRPGEAIDARRWLERVGLAALYLGLPILLIVRMVGS
jgi:apolipoprotein N-acyltransferase